MKRTALIPMIIFALIAAAAASPTAGDRDLIVRLQGEVLVLQRQIRDLQESVDRHHETSNAALQRLADAESETSKTLKPLAAQLNQSGKLQLQGVESLERRLDEVLASKADLKALSEELREIKALLARPPAQR
jgi:chromosome segregation ATPase